MFHQKTDPAKTSDLRQNRDVREILLPQQQKYQLQYKSLSSDSFRFLGENQQIIFFYTLLKEDI